jgi:dTMP kinase
MFIVFEGIDGCGKSTQIDFFHKYLYSKEMYNVIKTREPGCTELGVDIRNILLNKKEIEISPMAELFLFMADRVEHINKIINPALNGRYIVLCDRYDYSTFAYQLAREHSMEFENNLYKINEIAKMEAPEVDIVFYIQISVETSIKRKQAMGNLDRFESMGNSFLENVKTNYDLRFMNPKRSKEHTKYIIINGENSPHQVLSDIIKAYETYVRSV